MKYMLLINHGETPVPGTPEWDGVSQDEQRPQYGQTLTTDGRFVAAERRFLEQRLADLTA